MKKQLLDLDNIELIELVEKFGQPKYRAEQLSKCLLNGEDFDSMRTLPKVFLTQLQDDYHAQGLVLAKKQVSQDGTMKYLFELKNGGFVESVFLPNKYGNTICISNQVGCKFACRFCASGLSYERNLTPGEVLAQVVFINNDCGGTREKRAMANIVLMGSGEPLDNYDNVTKFLKLVISKEGMNFSNRNISLSTCGLVENIKRLADENFGITLSISLHATTDESRRQIMPVANKYSIKDVIDASVYYFEKTGRRVAFEYLMLDGINTNHLDAVRLCQISKRLSSHINLIPLNWVAEKSLKGINKEAAKRFCQKLNDMGVSATIRRSQGQDIDGACGQLRNGQKSKKTPTEKTNATIKPKTDSQNTNTKNSTNNGTNSNTNNSKAKFYKSNTNQTRTNTTPKKTTNHPKK